MYGTPMEPTSVAFNPWPMDDTRGSNISCFNHGAPMARTWTVRRSGAFTFNIEMRHGWCFSQCNRWPIHAPNDQAGPGKQQLYKQINRHGSSRLLDGSTLIINMC
jgi:hypothetical protein